jgi:pimeloyl-ACP methyl ester carboxylesterase
MPNAVVMKAMAAGGRLLSAVAPARAARLIKSVFITAARIRPMRPEEQALFARGRQRKVPFRNYQIQTWTWGDERAPAVLLAHGWGVTPALFTPLIEQLLAQGWRVVTYLAPSHAPGDPRKTTAMTLVHALKAVIDASGPFDALVGHSMGAGMLIMGSKIGIGAERLVLISTVTDLVDHTNRFCAAFGMPVPVAERMRALIWEQFRADCEPLGRDWPSLFDARVSTPTLLVHDEGDELLRISQSEYVAQRWPNSRLVRTQGQGHIKILRSPAMLDAVAQFLAASPALRARAAIQSAQAMAA